MKSVSSLTEDGPGICWGPETGHTCSDPPSSVLRDPTVRDLVSSEQCMFVYVRVLVCVCVHSISCACTCLAMHALSETCPQACRGPIWNLIGWDMEL